jgi:hypothetical protein
VKNEQHQQTAGSFERAMETKHARRGASEMKTDRRLNSLEERAEKMVGHLSRGGQVVSYIWPEGGKYQEGFRTDLVAFLIRNKYV